MSHVLTMATIVYVLIYLVVLFCYFFSETSGNHKRRSINKTILAVMFMAYAIFGTVFNIVNDGPYKIISLVLITSLLFCMIGDIVLLKSFSKGGIYFSVGNILLMVFNMLYLSVNGISVLKWGWFPLVLLVIWGGYMKLKKRGFIDFGKMDKSFSMYLLGVTLHGSLSMVGLLWLHDLKSVLIFAGSILYMISDYFISIATFKYPDYKGTKAGKISLRCNSLTYFVGLILIAVSTAVV